MYSYQVSEMKFPGTRDEAEVVIASGSGNERVTASALRVIADELDPPRSADEKERMERAGEKIAEEFFAGKFSDPGDFMSAIFRAAATGGRTDEPAKEPS